MKNNKDNNQEKNIESNNDAVLYSVMLSFLKKRADKDGRDVYDYYIRVDDEQKSIDLYIDESYGWGHDLVEEVKLN